MIMTELWVSASRNGCHILRSLTIGSIGLLHPHRRRSHFDEPTSTTCSVDAPKICVRERTLVAGGVEGLRCCVGSSLGASNVPPTHHSGVLMLQDVAVRNHVPGEFVDVGAQRCDTGLCGEDGVVEVADFVPGVVAHGDDLVGVHMHVVGVIHDTNYVPLLDLAHWHLGQRGCGFVSPDMAHTVHRDLHRVELREVHVVLVAFLHVSLAHVHEVTRTSNLEGLDVGLLCDLGGAVRLDGQERVREALQLDALSECSHGTPRGRKVPSRLTGTLSLPGVIQTRLALAAHRHVRTAARGEVDLVDASRGLQEKDSILGQELVFAMGLAVPLLNFGLPNLDQLLQGSQDKPHFVPLALRDRDLGPELTVHSQVGRQSHTLHDHVAHLVDEEAGDEVPLPIRVSAVLPQDLLCHDTLRGGQAPGLQAHLLGWVHQT
mmetsp:Transcript_57979/g.127095  ORF Transcript_57979/g.127095 Transcript_57979/m.127095 type:complete len:432 (+) Transcript_57979:156-1451(+)